jgi:hypothetical protein
MSSTRAIGEAGAVGAAAGDSTRCSATALNLNVHVHALVLECVYAEDDAGRLTFYGATHPTDEEMGAVLGTIAGRTGPRTSDLTTIENRRRHA